jgi:MinD-like ATPase involved in chromosome partitioning or flagellar assembly
MLISVEHGHGLRTLAVPDDLAIEALLPLMVETCGEDAGASWALLPRGGDPIPPRRTLRQAGVRDGSILTLFPTGPGERRPARAGRSPALPGVPRRRWLVERLALAGLAAGGHSSEEASAGGGGPLERVRKSWRATGHVARLERAAGTAAPGRGIVIALAPVRPGRGSTTVTALLAMLLARALPGTPLAIDADLVTRALTLNLGPRRRLDPDTYLALVEGRQRLGEAGRAGVPPYGVALLPAPEPAPPAPDAAACAALLASLRAAGDVVLVDCPASFATPWGQAAWAAADQFVLVADGSPGDLAAAAAAASRLEAAGTPVVVVANRARLRARTVRQAAALGLTAPVVAVPDDPPGAALLRAGQLPWEVAPPAWRRPVAQVAAALAARPHGRRLAMADLPVDRPPVGVP